MDDGREKIPKITELLDRSCRASGFRDFMPDLMISHFVRQIVPVSVKQNRLYLDQFYKWVRQEYSVPDHVFSRVFSRLLEELKELKVEMVLPESFEPSFDTAVMEWLRYEFKDVISADVQTDQRAEPTAAPAAPPPPASPAVHHPESWDREIIDHLYDADQSPGPATTPLLRREEPAETAPPLVGSAAEDELKSQLTFALRPQVIEGLRADLWPLVYDEVREQIRGELRGDIEIELKEGLRSHAEAELRSEITARLREELYPVLHEQVAAEIRRSERARLPEAMRAELLPAIREELRRELWTEVREEVIEDLRVVLRPVVMEELESGASSRSAPVSADELAVPAHGGSVVELSDWADVESLPMGDECRAEPAAAPVRLAAEDQLQIIRRIREALIPRLRDQFVSDLSTLARLRQEKEQRELRKKRLADPEYCLDRIRAFLFPDQPELWTKVKPLIRPEEWRPLVLLGEEGAEIQNQEKLARARSVIREALKLKAEIVEEVNYQPSSAETVAAKTRRQNLKKALSGADQLLDFALKNISEIISDLAPAPIPEEA